MGGMGRDEDVDTEKFYAILGVPKTATQQEIKRAYRKGAMQHHPDKGGDPEKFKEITSAHEVLSDPEKRKLYDQYGEKGLEAGGRGGGGDASDIFSQMFGGGGGGGGRRGPRKGKDVRFRLGVTMADLYSGATKKLRLTKSVICTGCKGAGGSNVKTCASCKGRGAKTVLRQLGPGMVQQMQMHCDVCDGEGEIMARKDRCKECLGEKIKKEKKTLEVHINKGMKNGEKVIFRGESDEAPGIVAGDVIVELECSEHATLKRQGDHLFYKRKITLLESLVGFEFSFLHLDGRVIKVQSTPGATYPHECFKCIQDEGFPTRQNPFVRGNMYVEFQVEWPDKVDRKFTAQLSKILPTKKSDTFEAKEGAEIEEVMLTDVDMEVERHRMKQEAREGQGGDSDDEGGAQQASCRSQ